MLARFSPLALVARRRARWPPGVDAGDRRRAHARRAASRTAYGRAVLIKVGLLLALIGWARSTAGAVVPALRRVAAAARRRAGPAGCCARTLRAEVALVLVVLGVTGALTGYAPPAAAAAGPQSVSKRMGPLDLELTVDPARDRRQRSCTSTSSAPATARPSPAPRS